MCLRGSREQVFMFDTTRQALFRTAVKSVRWIRRHLLGRREVTLAIDQYWSDERHCAVQGWLAGDQADIEAIELKAGGVWVGAERLAARPDVSSALRKPVGAVKGFTFQVAHGAPMALSFRVKQKGRWTPCRVKQPPPDCAERLAVPDGEKLFDRFVEEVNERHWHVLEIGSRIVSPGSESKRGLFPKAASFTGFDYYPDGNTDIVGDAHRLADIVGEKKFDAVFSIAVLEHLAMPWIVAREINRVLRVGGITYHGTLFSWPTHERPWDFWRLSDDGLKVLFSPALGYDVLGAGMFDPVSMHFRALRRGQEGFPNAAAYASSSILCRKKSDTSQADFRWPADLGAVVGGDSRYPPATTQPRLEKSE